MRHEKLGTPMKFGLKKASKSSFLSTSALIKAAVMSAAMGFSAIGTAQAQDSDGDGVSDALEGFGVLPDGTLISTALGGTGLSTDPTAWENVLATLRPEQVFIESFEDYAANTALDGLVVPNVFSLSVLSVGGINPQNDVDGREYGTNPRTGARQATFQMNGANQITTFEMNFNTPVAGFGMYFGDIHDGGDTTRLQILFDDVAVWDSTDFVGGDGVGVVTDSITGRTQTLGNRVFGFIGSYDLDDLTQKVTFIYHNNPDNDNRRGNDNFTVDDISIIYPGVDCDGDGVLDHEQADNEFIGVVKSVNTSALSSPPQAGEEVTYSYTVSNLCATTMYDVSVAETPASFTGTGTLPVPIYVSGGSSIDLDPATGITFDPAIADLDADDDAPIVFEATYAITQDDIHAGGVDNSATAAGTDGSGSNQESDVSDPVTPGVAGDNVTSFSLAQVPNLSISKLADDNTDRAIGETITYTYTATNTGNVNITDVTISDEHNGSGTLSAVTLDALLNTSGNSSDDSVDNDIDVLAPNDSATFEATYVVTVADVVAGTDITNTATVTGTPVVGALPTTPITADEAVTVAEPKPSLSMTKVADNTGPYTAGDVVTYTYTVVNDGDQIVRDISITDTHNGSDPAPVPGNETLLTDAGTQSDSTDAAVDGSWDVLAPGDVLTFTGTYTITQSDAETL